MRESRFLLCSGLPQKETIVTLKLKYEALNKLDKNRPNKEVAVQFSEVHLLLGKKQLKNIPSFSKFMN